MKFNLYIINSEIEHNVYFSNPKKLSVMDWHISLGHPSYTAMKHLQLIDKKELEACADQIESCEVCAKAKQSRNSFPVLNRRSNALFEIVHADVWGPYTVGNICVLTLVEGHSRLIWVELLSGKDQVCSIFKNFITMVRTQFHTMIKQFQTDNGSEFLNQAVSRLFADHGILHHRFCTYTPQ